MESIHVNFDELPQMASDQNSSDPTPECQTTALNHDSLSLANQQTYAENDQAADDEFINIFSTPVQDQGETSSRHVDSSNMHTFYQRFPSEHRWTKDHPLEQVIRNPSQLVRTRRQHESDAEMYMFALTVSRTEPKNIKESMADSAWIESMQEELHQFDRLDVWELVERTKHIDVRYHFIKEKVKKGIVELFFIGTEYKFADLFTKSLPVERFQYLVRRLGMRCLTPAELEALANEPA
nr:Gag-Pol polyprotein [Tanacetum cinerariifolium]